MTELLPLDTEPRPVKLRVADYLLLDTAGAFSDYVKTELIEGEVYFMNAQHRPHALLKMRLYDALRDVLRDAGSDLTPLVEASIAVPANSVPEPDIVVTSEAEGEGLIPLASVALVVEVADSTLDNDLNRKAALYSAAGIAEYWVADVAGRLLHQMWAPGAARYAEYHRQDLGTVLDAVTLPIRINLPASDASDHRVSFL